MSILFDDRAKKRLADGRNRDPALRVIIPRVIGAFVTDGRVVQDENSEPILEVKKGPFWMRLEPDTRHVNFFIHHRAYGVVMSGRLYSDGNGNKLDGRLRLLGRVDGFDDDEAQSECDEGSEVLVRFLATERNALEALELADEVFDAGAGAIERLREESRLVLGR